jgi:hypothetical protein
MYVLKQSTHETITYAEFSELKVVSIFSRNLERV